MPSFSCLFPCSPSPFLLSLCTQPSGTVSCQAKLI
jgi:hypothetical protein